MSKIILFNSKENGYSFKNVASISNAVKKAEDFAYPKLGIDWNIDVIIHRSNPIFPNAKDRVSGHTYEDNLIRLIVEDGFSEFEISEVLVHELCHAARWRRNNEWVVTLFDAIIFEGLAVCFTEMFSANNPKRQYYMKTIVDRSDEENEKIFNKLKDDLLDNNYDYNSIFRGDGNSLPYWSGYSLGYYLIKKYLEKTGKAIEDAYADRYKDIESFL